MRHLILYVTLLTLPLLGSCSSLLDVNVTVVGERTALENQILGTYERLNTDLTMYSSVRALGSDGTVRPARPLSESKRAALRALAEREYQKDDIDRMLLSGFAGESREGVLVTRGGPPPEGMAPELAAHLLASENQFRRTLLDRVSDTQLPGDRSGDDKLTAAFAAINAREAPAGSWVESPSGKWAKRE